MRRILFGVLFLSLLCVQNLNAQSGKRVSISLDDNWQTIASESDINAYKGFEKVAFNASNWQKVNVPHNWDKYEGYRRLVHGNLHGYSWYRKSFTIKEKKNGKRFFLMFEGVGSYATVFLNGNNVGYHAGGRTSFTLDVTDIIQINKPNLLAVRADHPAHIQDLPWVCGGCSTERGFSEGSQPMGVFRPVHLIVTNDVRIEPFGVHIWNDTTVTEKSALLNMNTELKNYSNTTRNIVVSTQIINKQGVKIADVQDRRSIAPGAVINIAQQTPQLQNVQLWSLENPYLYTILTTIKEKGKVIDELSTPYGIRWISWPIGKKGSNQFFLNGKPVFINGIAEYEHLIGESHAFSAEQVRSRALLMKSAGFNAFRDGHQPHNLRYQEYWDNLGMLWWTQLAAHIWYDTPEFRKNFKTLLVDWVKERRNSPSVVLWGLENESTLPEDFARECTELIRSLDPTASLQRLVTTCNGGKGTDWDVPQNWTGTYGGDPNTYAEDVQRQILIGEYGAWRTLDLHTEGPFNQNGVFSEDRMAQLMELKIRLAESVRDKTAGHFFWLFTSHDNPGRVQGGEGLRELDRIGPVNYKGLLTPWEEPLDVFYMFRSNYAPKATDPMIYIVSHTWPDRWTKIGKKDSITVYSNCDEVELFNDVDHLSLGRKKRGGIGTHFQWDNVDINYNVLYAKGYVNGKEVVTDYIVLNHLPQSPNFNSFFKGAKPVTKPQPKYNYLYRVNCGGPEYKDENGSIWQADRQQSSNDVWGSNSWTKDFPGTPAFFASQRRTHDPIAGTRDGKLFQTFRYGRDKLNYQFPVKDGEYLVELYFTEPWLGTGSNINFSKMRLFDVAINDRLVLKDIDIWKEAGHDAALKKTIKVKVTGGKLVVSFPNIRAGQALISAIAIASLDENVLPAPPSKSIVEQIQLTNGKTGFIQTWMDTGDKQFENSNIAFTSLPSNFYGAEWLSTPRSDSKLAIKSFKLTEEADVFIAINGDGNDALLNGYEDTRTFLTNSENEQFNVFRKRFLNADQVSFDNASKNNYTIVVIPVSDLEPAHDLKKVVSYKAIDASFLGNGLVKEELMGRERATFKKKSGDVLEFTINTGVADTYSLTVKYHNPFQRILTGRIEVFAADGTLMKKAEEIEFNPTKEGKWNYFTTNTGTMINAGTYKVRLIADDVEGLSVDALDVQ